MVKKYKKYPDKDSMKIALGFPKGTGIPGFKKLQSSRDATTKLINEISLNASQFGSVN